MGSRLWLYGQDSPYLLFFGSCTEIKPIANSEFESRKLNNPYNLPLTFKKKYTIIDKNEIGFAILDDIGIRREFQWGAPHFKITGF